jgi:RimJ/RimL family protein N-acetyltransferase
VLQTDRLILESLEVAHADRLVGLLDPRVYEHFLPEDAIHDIGQLRAQFAALTRFNDATPPGERLVNLVVMVATSGALIGRLEALMRGANVELAFMFTPDSWGHGYASEAVRCLQDHLAQQEEIKQLWTSVTPTNARSLMLCRRLGFEPASPDTWPDLATYDEGDIVMNMQAGPHC